MRKYVAYYRVSTQRQGQSGLGLEAQQEAVRAFLGRSTSEVVAEFTEVETGKGANALARRPQLRAALALAKAQKATLVIAKLDRLARNVAFISALMESGADFVAVDMPEANRLMLHVMAAFAEYERTMISKRTTDALAAAKLRGPVFCAKRQRMTLPLGAMAQERATENKAQAVEALRPLAPILAELRERQLTQRAMAAELNDRGVNSPGGGKWHRSSVHKALARLDAALEATA
jgi:DNA invertase Pin-like site-specific DNA recombinase